MRGAYLHAPKRTRSQRFYFMKRVLLEKLVSLKGQEIAQFTEYEGLIEESQEPTTYLHPKRVQSGSQTHIPFSKILSKSVLQRVYLPSDPFISLY